MLAPLTSMYARPSSVSCLKLSLAPRAGVRLGAAQALQVALARLILADPHTLILDEATSLLDPRSARRLERSMAAVLAGRTVVAIAHRLHTGHDADRVIVMEDGQIREMGSHHELVGAGGAYAALWQSWHGGPRPGASAPVIPRSCGQTVDGAVESCHAHGINNRCPVDG
jgi:ABC-type dipeptide/oligopeptide/nickel transport system ATPase component